MNRPRKPSTSDTAKLLAIAAKLEEQARRAAPGPSLQERIKAIFANVDREDHAGRLDAQVRVMRMLHAAGIYTDAELAEDMAFLLYRLGEQGYDDDPELARLNAAINAANKAHGLPEEEWGVLENMPADVKELTDEWERRAEAVIDATFRAYGEDALADLLRSDYDAFLKLDERARVRIFPKTSAATTTGPC